MAQVMRMPSEAKLPRGPLRDFVELLWVFYRQARRPKLREISNAIRDGDYPGTASPETIRRMLHGTTVPVNWETVEAVFEVLLGLAGWDPDGRFTYEGYDRGSPRKYLLGLWHRAIDDRDIVYIDEEPPF